jgi:hypothetical protein
LVLGLSTRGHEMGPKVSWSCRVGWRTVYAELVRKGVCCAMRLEPGLEGGISAFVDSGLISDHCHVSNETEYLNVVSFGFGCLSCKSRTCIRFPLPGARPSASLGTGRRESPNCSPGFLLPPCIAENQDEAVYLTGRSRLPSITPGPVRSGL